MASQVIGLQPASKVELFKQTRDDALRCGDAGVYRAMCVELDRLGYTDTTTSTRPPVETAAVSAPERAVPAVKRTRRVA